MTITSKPGNPPGLSPGPDPKWKEGDWAVFDLSVVQIKQIREGNSCSVSDGSFETSGMLLDRLRPLTLRNKRIVEWFDYYYNELRKIRGEGGFNYPSISQRFYTLALSAIDGDDKDKESYDLAMQFVQDAREYKPIIQNIYLFRER